MPAQSALSALVIYLAVLTEGTDRMPNYSGYTTFCPADKCDAAREKRADTLREYAERGYSLCTCVCDENMSTLVHLSATSGCLDCISVLVQDGSCNINPTDADSSTPLHLASSLCDVEMIKALLEKGALVNFWDGSGYTPVCIAAASEKETCAESIEELVAGGAAVCRACRGKYPFYLASSRSTKRKIAEHGGKRCYGQVGEAFEATFD